MSFADQSVLTEQAVQPVETPAQQKLETATFALG
jgi:hypothetical protein